VTQNYFNNFLSLGFLVLLISSTGCRRDQSRPVFLPYSPPPPVRTVFAERKPTFPPTKNVVLSPDQEPAEAEAVINAFEELDLSDLKNRVGIVFLKGIPTKVVKVVNDRIGDRLPEMRSSIETLDTEHWVDKLSGKRALVVTLYDITEVSETSVSFDLVIQFNCCGGAQVHYVKINKGDKGWFIKQIGHGIE